MNKMNSSKPIDISKSSLVGLKAELLKKQEEVKRLKELQQDNVKPDIIPKKKSVQQKSNEGKEKRLIKDTSAIEDDNDTLQKSREVLEAKSRLYDKLKGNTVDEETKSKYLIDFDLKRELDVNITLHSEENETTKHSENEADYSDHNSDPENDWVDFVDTLGRSRRCLRKDLPEVRAKDAKLAVSLHPPSPPPDTAPVPTPELLSWDMQREMMRKKWEEQETLLLGKKDIHYQDVRFDEARPHGVGYFEFSKDEAERVRQQEELQKLRAQTVEQQEAAQGLRARRQQQLQARLAAAKQRRRERLGLPPESPPHEAELTTVSNEREQKEGAEETVIDLEDSVKKVAPVRPWDIGKNGAAPVMSQEEWIEKKRQERPEEFAPPSSLTETINLENIGSADQKWKQNPNIFTSKRLKQKSLLNEKFQQKNKKSKVKLEGEIKKRPYKESEDIEESFGPSVKELQEVSQQNSYGISTNNTFSNINDFYTPVGLCSMSNVPEAERKNEEFPEPSRKSWKPTISDIDLLLSKSRTGSFDLPLEKKNVNHRLSQDPTKLMSTSSSLVDTENSVEQQCTVTSGGNTNAAKSKNCNNHTSKHSKRKKYHNGPVDKSIELFDDSRNSETVIKPIINLLELDSDRESSFKKCEEQSKWKSKKRTFSEIPPPPSMSYYIDTDKKSDETNSSSKPQLADSISAGINYLKSQTEEKRKKRLKGMLDII